MKISKLFHWLYAFLMFLPIFAVGVTWLYTIFNKNAMHSYSYQQSSEYHIELVNEVTFYNYYTFDTSEDLFSCEEVDIYVASGTFVKLDTHNTYPSNVSSFTYFYNQNGYFIKMVGDTTAYLKFADSGQNIIDYFSFSFKLDSSNPYALSAVNPYYDNLREIVFGEQTYLDRSFYTSIDTLKSSGFFSWSKESFLAQPITYITDVFGMDSDNVIIYFLSYWLDISIIWLTFDLIMYVPLLVHRWLDKGVLD